MTLTELNKKRILAISDIHGQPNKLRLLLKEINYDYYKDQLILLGDYTDRGNKNVEAIRLVMQLKELGAIVLKGNHDDLLEGCLQELLNNLVSIDCQNLVSCGGYNTYQEVKTLNHDEKLEIYKFLETLPHYYEIDNYIFVHAGIEPNLSIAETDENTLLWGREWLDFPYDGTKVVVFGHTPTPYLHANSTSGKLGPSKIWFSEQKNRIGIDCGSVFNGSLACLELPSMKEYYISSI